MAPDLEDDDGPPELVDTSALPASEKPTTTSVDLDTPPQYRVPITLVTGIACSVLALELN